MALHKPVISEKVHYSGPSGGGGGGFHPHGGGGGGYGGGAHVYSSVGHSGYGGYGGSHDSHSSKGGKRSVALSALTLLAFLFFLHILQTCLQDQMTETTTTTNVVVMSARGENQKKRDVMKKRKGDVEDLDGEYANDYAEKKSTINWDEMDKQVVTTRVKTFTKYDQPDHV